MTQIGLECFFDSIITWLISSKIIKIENFSSFVLSYSHKLLKRKLMDDMINRHDSIAEENIEPNGRPAKDQFEEWSGEVADRADDVFKNDKKDGPIKDPFFAIYAKKRKSDLSGYYLIVISICIFLGISSTPYFFLNIALALCTEVSLEGLRLDTIIAFFLIVWLGADNCWILASSCSTA